MVMSTTTVMDGDDGTSNNVGDGNDNTVVIPWPAILIRDMTTFPDNVIDHKVQVLKQTSENDQRRKMAITNRITINNAELVEIFKCSTRER